MFGVFMFDLHIKCGKFNINIIIIKMKHLKFYLVALVAILAFPSWGQSRGHYLHITVTAPKGKGLCWNK